MYLRYIASRHVEYGENWQKKVFASNGKKVARK